MNLIKTRVLILLFLTQLYPGLAQESSIYSSSPVLDTYIKTGLQNNLGLKQKEFDLQKSSAALDEARGLFMPTLGLSARYSRANGGRSFDMPLGDLLNPVYGSLNEIFTAMDRAPKPFPNLENQTFSFFREKEHETKARLIQPIFQPAIYYNYKMKNKRAEISLIDLQLYKRKLIKDIKQAYFKVLESSEILTLLNSTRILLEENLRISRKLMENQMATKETVFRSNAELLQIRQKILQANNQKRMAGRYFNFLLNRPLNESITLARDKHRELISPYRMEESVNRALKNREEFLKLSKAAAIRGDQQKIHNASLLPTLNLVADFGYQGEAYIIDDTHDYWMVSGVLEWNLFRGFQDKAKKEQARIEFKKIQLQERELAKQVELQVSGVVDKINALIDALQVSAQRKNSANESFRVVNKKYSHGLSTLIEFLDARNTLTQSQIDEILIRFSYWEAVAELEWITASAKI